MNIVLTGGHAGTTALSVIEELKKQYEDFGIHWIGPKYSMPSKKETTLEFKIFPKYGVNFNQLDAGKIQTKFTNYTIPLLLKIPFSFVRALILLIKIKPKVILSFGGSSAFPVVFCGWILRIPVLIHEQTLVAGRANLISIPFAKYFLLAHIESQKYFPIKKSIVVGNPLLSSISALTPLTTYHTPFTILIMGGSRGSEFINDEVLKIHDFLVNNFYTIHITGTKDYEKIKSFESKKYKVISQVSPDKMYDLYSKVDMAICRSGANTVSEIEHLKIFSILIPLPRTYLDEQVKNAQYLEKLGIGYVMLEKEVNPMSLITLIKKIADKKKVIKINTLPNPAIKIVKVISDLIG